MCTDTFGVMVVSDNDADLDTISYGLQSLDPPPCMLSCRTAGEALEALHTRQELFNATTTFAILVEANLPLVSGLELVACMRCDASLSRIPVFVLAGSSSDCAQFDAHELGVAGCLRKPTSPGESKTIAARIEAYMRSKNSSDRLRQAGYGRARMACLPHRAAAASPAARRRSIATNAG